VVLRGLLESCEIDIVSDDHALAAALAGQLTPRFRLSASHLIGLGVLLDEPLPELLPPWRLDGTYEKAQAVLAEPPCDPPPSDLPDEAHEGVDDPAVRTEPLTFV
jgi:hypothetical protein